MIAYLPSLTVFWAGTRHEGRSLASKTKLEYRPDLDGMRAIAVVAVVLYHFGVPYVPGGFVGVDVFFVLSGYFISRQIFTELDQGRFSLTGFYDRRIRRLFPALFLMLAVTTAAASVLLLPDELERFGRTLLGAALSVSNFVFWRESGYFAPAAQAMPLLHTWSLAVEEQFYLLFPVAMMLLWRLGRLPLTVLLVTAVVGSFGLGVWMTGRYPATAFYLLPFRFWELAMGCVLGLAVVPAPRGPWREILRLAGLAMVFAAIFLFDKSTPMPGVSALLPCVGTAFVILAGLGEATGGHAGWPGARPQFTLHLLSAPPMVVTGLMSYSLYLWHWPILVLAEHRLATPLDGIAKGVLLAVVVMAAAASWLLVERPLRTGQYVWTRSWHRYAVGLAMVILVALVGEGLRTRVLQGPVPPTEVLDLASAASDISPKRGDCHGGGLGFPDIARSCLFGEPAGQPLVVLADSHGVELAYALAQELQGKNVSIRQLTASGCPPASGFTHARRTGCAAAVSRVLEETARLPPATVIVTAYYFRWHEPPTREPFWTGYADVVRKLAAQGHRVILLGAVPPFDFLEGLPSAMAKAVWHGQRSEDYQFTLDKARAAEIDVRLVDIARSTGAAYLPLIATLCPDGSRCQGYAGDRVLLFDTNHLSLSGARRVVNEIVIPVIKGGPGLLPAQGANASEIESPVR